MQRISVLPDWLPTDRSALNNILNRVAGEFGLAATLFDVMGGGLSGAPVFRITNSDGQLFAAKCFAETSPEFARELMLRHQFVHEIVRTSELPLPLARTRIASGTTVLHAGGTWQIESWMPGNPLLPGSVSPEMLEVAMQFMARLHESLHDTACQPQWQQSNLRRLHAPSPAIRKRFDLTRQLANGELDELAAACKNQIDAEIRSVCMEICTGIRQRLPQLLEKLAAFVHVPIELQPVFRDVRADHLLFTEGTVTGLIDLSLLATDHRMLDLTRLLRSWFEADSSAIEAGIRSYAGHLRRINPDTAPADVLDECGVVLSPVVWIRRLLKGGMPQSIPREVALNRLKQQADLLKNFTPLRQLLLKPENH